MIKRWMVVGAALLLAALVSMGCSLVADPDSDAGGGIDPDPAGDPGDSGTIVINVATEPANQAGSFTFTGVPSGTLTTESGLVVSDLEPGTYTTTQVDPAPDFDLTAVVCDDGDSALASSGDPQTRTAVLNLDPGETLQCTFTNTRRASAVVVAQTEPDGAAGTFLFTGVPSGTVPTNGTLVVANLSPGTYTATEADPTPEFDLTAVSCDDGSSATASMGDPVTRSAIFQLDPAEVVVCTFINTRRGTAVVTPDVTPDGSEGTFTYTGVPSGTVGAGGTLIVANLSPGTYTTTEVDPAPDFELTEVVCDDGEGGTASLGDAATRSAIFNVDAGETVRCTFTHERAGDGGDGGIADDGGGTSDQDDGSTDEGIDPFDDPETYLGDFPLPDELPPDAGSATVPREGPWIVNNLAGSTDCGGVSLAIPAGAPERGEIAVLEGGQTLVGTSLQEEQTEALTMTANPDVRGHYIGATDGTEQGVRIVINHEWQVVTETNVVGFLTSSFTAEGVTCTVYRPYVLNYDG